MADHVDRSFLVHVPHQRRLFVGEQKWCLTWLMTALASLLIKRFSVKYCMVIFTPNVCVNQRRAVYSDESSVEVNLQSGAISGVTPYQESR